MSGLLSAEQPPPPVIFSKGTKVVIRSSRSLAIIQKFDESSQKYTVVIPGVNESVDVDACSLLSTQEAIREIQRDKSLNSSMKSLAIRDIQMPPKYLPDDKETTSETAVVPSSRHAPVCLHYQCKCVIIAACCDRVFQCRVCHDEHISSHKIDRFATARIICVCCDKIQPVSNQCIQCSVVFSDYYCEICKLWKADDERGTFHCQDCGICRIGFKENYFHCKNCGLCIPISTVDDHLCLVDKYKQDCPVCRTDLQTSREAVVTMPCGHPIHQQCLNQLFASGMLPRCPLCKKSAGVLDSLWENIQSHIDQQPMPPREESGAPEFVAIICNDCEKSDDSAPFHFLGMRCRHCLSFNTAIADGK